MLCLKEKNNSLGRKFLQPREETIATTRGNRNLVVRKNKKRCKMHCFHGMETRRILHRSFKSMLPDCDNTIYP